MSWLAQDGKYEVRLYDIDPWSDMGVFTNGGIPKMDGLFHGNSYFNRWFRGTPILRKLHIGDGNRVPTRLSHWLEHQPSNGHFRKKKLEVPTIYKAYKACGLNISPQKYGLVHRFLMIVSHALMAYQIWRTVFHQIKCCWLGPVGPDDFVGHGGWPWWVGLVGKPPQFMGLGVSELPLSKFHVALFKKLYRTQRHRTATPNFKRISGELCSSTILLWRWSHMTRSGESTNLSPKELLGWTTVAVDESLGESLEKLGTVGLGHHVGLQHWWVYTTLILDDFGMYSCFTHWMIRALGPRKSST